jgi:isoleucyl-tRNA synthetase
LVANANGITVALDITIRRMKQEGIARELVNRIQNIRKDLDLKLQIKLKFNYRETVFLEQAILKNEDYIKSETLTNELVLWTR